MSGIVITIARQYGSGGRTIGQMLAKELGVEFYDRDILRLASEDSGINERLFNQTDEKPHKGILSKIVKRVYDGELITPDSKDFSSVDNLFNYQAKIIRELAQEESCVIIGRCADYILKDQTNVVRVFVHAPWEFRVEQASQKISGSREDVEKFLLKDDKRKQEYYRKFTGGVWNDATNYDLCLNSGKLGFEKCVDAIEAQLKIMLDK